MLVALTFFHKFSSKKRLLFGLSF